MTETPRHRLRRILREFRAGRLGTDDFCSQFEHTYNLELDKGELSPDERSAFAPLFEVVVWYSPFPDERADVPNYRSEADVAHAAEVAAQLINETE